ncbi:MAG: hypothetical protein KatS3mg082_1397 [Nitrospiraceae bacterium]|nr:MAG: hypothetical protein KatS3mg082_1397 [Nitrospiraceae bacterium]
MSRRTKAYNKAKHVVVDALQHIVREVPSVTEKFYWGGTGAIAYDECPMKKRATRTARKYRH